MPETIGRQTASYREGLVLGLTMAEIMLLLVFCLLVGVGVALVKERGERDEALAHLKSIEATAAADAAMVASISRNPELAELLEQRTGPASRQKIDEFWRTLVESNDIVGKLEQQGVPRGVLRDKAGSFAQLRQLITRNISPDKLARALALETAIDTPYRNSAKLAPDEIVSLIERGLAAASATPNTEPPRLGGHTWPPIINLSEANGYFFATGRAELTPDFEYGLRTSVARRLLEIASSYDVDVIEVIGHTDEQPVTSRASNLDRNLPGVVLGETDPNSLQWGDNAGLGLARALAVVRVLSADPRLQAFRILPLSAAQLIDTDGTLTRWDYQGDVRERRRIEIRMRKSA
jgi:flagellar motor protein MotB